MPKKNEDIYAYDQKTQYLSGLRSIEILTSMKACNDFGGISQKLVA